MAKMLNRNLVGGLTLAGMIVLAGAGFLLITNLPGRDPKVYEDEAKKYEDKGEWNQAMQTYGRAYTRDPDHNPEYLIKAAHCAIADGSVGTVRELISQARVKDSQLRSAAELITDFEFELAKLFPSSLQWNRVLNEAKKLAGMVKDSALAQHAMGQAYLNLQREEPSYRQKGEEALKRALELNPGSADIVEVWAREQWSDAMDKMRAGMKTEAEAIEKTANEMVGAAMGKCPPDKTKEIGKLKRLQAFYALMKGDFEKATTVLQALAESDKSSPDNYLFLGSVYSGLSVGAVKQDLKKAEECFQKAMEIDPKDGRAYQGLSQVYKYYREQEKEPQKRLARMELEAGLYKKGLETIPKTKHFREIKNNLSRIFFFTELFLLDLDRVVMAGGEESKRKEPLASAESWLNQMKQEVNPDSIEVRFLTASYLNTKGELVAATKEAEAANRMNEAERHVRLQALLAELYSNQNQWGAASKALRKALQIMPTSPILKIRLGQVYLQLNEPTLALIELKPSEPGPLRDYLLQDEYAGQLRMEAYRQLGQVELAAEEAKKLSSGTTKDELREIRLLMTEQRYNEAEAKLKPILAQKPDNEAAARMLFRVYEATDRFADAKAMMKDLLAKHPDKVLYRQLQLVVLEHDKDDEATQAFLKEEKDAFLRAGLLSDFYARRDKIKEAMEQMDQAEKIKPNDSQVIDRQLRLAASAKDWPRMEKYVARDAALNADGTEGKIASGRMAYAQGKYKEAVDLITAGLAKYPSSSMGWTYLAEAYLAMEGRTSEAKNAINKALDVDPTNGYANRAMAQILLAEGDVKAGDKHVQTAARALPDDKWLRRQMQIIKEQENPATGITTRERIRRDNPNDLENLVLLSRLYADTKVAKYDLAAEVYRQALKVSKNDLRLAREVAKFFGRPEVNLPSEGESLLREMMNAEQDKVRKAQVAVCMGQFYEVQKSLVSADRQFRLAVSLDPSNEVLAAAGEFYARTNRYKDAVDYYARLLKQATRPEDAALAQTSHARIVALWLAIGDLDNAKKQIDQFVANYPNDPQGMIFAGAYHRIGGDIHKAKESFDNHLQRDPNSPVALWQRGQMYMLMGKWQSALEDLRKSKTFSPDGFLYQHRIALADTLLELGRGDEAIVELRSILDQHPEEQAVAEALVDAYVRVKPPRFSDAENVLFTYMRLYPKDFKWPYLLGRVGERMQKWDKAVQGFEKAAELSRENRDVIASLFNAYKHANHPKSMTDYLAEKLSERQLERMPMQLAYLAWAYHQTGMKDKALEFYDRALTAAGEDFVMYTQVVSEMIGVIGLKEALSRAQERAASDSKNIEKQKAIVHLLHAEKRTEEALAAAKKVAEIAVRDQDVIFAHLAQGMLLDQLNRGDESKVHYEAVLKIDPKQPTALNNLAYLLAERMNKPAEALLYAQQAVRADPNNANALDTLGFVLLLNHRTGEAIGALLRAKDIERDDCTTLYHLGLAYQQKGDAAEAKQWLDRAKKQAQEKGDQQILPKILKALGEA